MTWTPKNCESFSVCMIEADGTQSVIFDITPARWTTRVSLEDAILSLAAKSMSPYERNQQRWHFSSDIKSGPIPYWHPDYEYSPCAINIHNGMALENKVILTYQGGDFVLPDGTRKNLTHFANSNTTFYKDARKSGSYGGLQHNLSAIPNIQTHDGVRHTLATMVFGAAVCTGEDGLESMINKDTNAALLMAQTVALITKSFINCKWAGSDAISKGNFLASSIANTLIDSWILRPDCAWYSTRWTIDQGEVEKLKSTISDPIAFQAGYEMMKKAIEVKATHDTLSLIPSSLTPAHYKMLCKKHQKDVEDAGLLVFGQQPERLKTRASGRAVKLANAA